MNLRYCSSCAPYMGLGLLSLVFFYPIDFVVKHPVAPEINPVPTLGWVRTALPFPALLKDQHPKRCSSLNSRVCYYREGNCRSLGFARDDKVESSFAPCHWLAGAEDNSMSLHCASLRPG